MAPLLRTARAFYRADRSLLLQAAILALLIGLPFLTATSLGQWILFGLLTVLALAPMSATGRSLLWRTILLMVGIPAIALLLLADQRDERIFTALFFLLYTVLLFAAAWIMLRRLLRSSHVSAASLRWAVSVYLLLGLAWAMLYLMLVKIDPQAFQLPQAAGHQPVTARDPSQFLAFVYYSFVTLTTLGYGDITPRNGIARTASYLEAIAGQIYLAVVIARFVGMSLTQPRQPPGPTEQS